MPSTPSTSRPNAVVIGASMAGLNAAVVLARRGFSVTIVERDALQENGQVRRGVPQARHVHALLVRGMRSMEARLPGLTDSFHAAGAVAVNLGLDTAWYIFGVARPTYTSALSGMCLSRPVMEEIVRAHALREPGVTVRAGLAWTGLVMSQGRVSGVTVQRSGAQGVDLLPATIVVDASGRGSPLPRLLKELGYEAPTETIITSKAAYSTRVYQGMPSERAALTYVQPNAPDVARGAIIAPMEGGRFVLTLIGMAGDHPPTDEAGFLDFADSLAVPDIADFIRRNTPVSPIYAYARAENRMRHWHELARLPEGLLVMGDAAVAFNPVYGQGMTAASLGADALDELLDARQGRLDGLTKEFQAKLRKVVDLPWQLATGEDRRWPIAENAAGLPLANRILNAYIERLQRASLGSAYLCDAFYRVAQMVDGPESLFKPGVLWRVIFGGSRRIAVSEAPRRLEVSKAA